MSDVLAAVQAALREYADPSKTDFQANWFKNRPGYPPDDAFLGVSVPMQRKIANRFYRSISLHDTAKLLASKWHEERLTALFILIKRYQRFDFNRQDIFDIYISHLQHVNNWDLVDASAPQLVGAHLQDSPYKMKALRKMAQSEGVWERRAAMIATLHFIKSGSAGEALELAALLLHDDDTYIHKAVGWMLREVGKRVDERLLTGFLDKYADVMPRTALRYAIEKLPQKARLHYMQKRDTISLRS